MDRREDPRTVPEQVRTGEAEAALLRTANRMPADEGSARQGRGRIDDPPLRAAHVGDDRGGGQPLGDLGQELRILTNRCRG